jgi:hypothetical protein
VGNKGIKPGALKCGRFIEDATLFKAGNDNYISIYSEAMICLGLQKVG